MNRICYYRTVCRSHSPLSKTREKVAIYLEWNPLWLYHNSFRATLPTSLLITQSWCNCGVNETIVFHGLWAQSYFKGFSTPKFVSSVALLKYLFLSTRVPFLLYFTMIRSVLFLFLQSFNYLITYPRGNYFHLHNTALQLFQLFGEKNIFSTLMETFSLLQKVFRFTLQTLLELSFSSKLLKKIFFGLQSSSLRKDASFSSVSFPSLFCQTRHGGVGQRSGTGLATPLLSWALPLKILNHVSLGVDVPVFFHLGDVASFSYFFSLFRYTLSGYLIHNSITNLLVIKALLFDLGSTQYQILVCARFCPPLPFFQDRVAVGPTA